MTAAPDGLARGSRSPPKSWNVPAWAGSTTGNWASPTRSGWAWRLSSAIALGDWRLYFLQGDRLRQVDAGRREPRGQHLDQARQPQRGPVPPPKSPTAHPRWRGWTSAPLVKDYQEGDPNVAQAEAFDPTPATLDARTKRVPGGGPEGRRCCPRAPVAAWSRPAWCCALATPKACSARKRWGPLQASLVDKGGAGMTRQQIADAFEKLQAEVGFGSDDQTLNVNITTKRDRLPAVIELVGRLLREPAFPAEPLEEARRQWLTRALNASARSRSRWWPTGCPADGQPLTRVATCATPRALTRWSRT